MALRGDTHPKKNVLISLSNTSTRSGVRGQNSLSTALSVTSLSIVNSLSVLHDNSKVRF